MNESVYVKEYLHFDANEPSHVNYFSRRWYELEDLNKSTSNQIKEK